MQVFTDLVFIVSHFGRIDVLTKSVDRLSGGLPRRGTWEDVERRGFVVACTEAIIGLI